MNADWVQQRVKMVDGQVRTTDVTDTSLLDAMLEVPREVFVGERRRALAYSDEHIEIAPAADGRPPRYLIKASPFAKLVQLAAIRLSDTVLDVGCGTGYSAAVLSKLAASVLALESEAALADEARSALLSLGCANVAVAVGPLTEGFQASAPFDVIFVGGSITAPPDRLLSQLREGGRLVAVEGGGNSGIARLYLKFNGVVSGRSAFNAALKPLPGFEPVAAFDF